MPDPIDEIIQRAMQDGKFDELPGKGKPLKLEDNPHEDPSWRLAHHILKTSGFSLPWIESLREIESIFHHYEMDLELAWDFYQNTLVNGDPSDENEAGWRRAMQTFRTQIRDLNKAILKTNLAVPTAQFQLPLIDADREIARIIQPQSR